jgi:3-oxo-5-alpha-steroid 4-dehydrogenase 1
LSELRFFHWLIVGWFVLAAIVFLSLLFFAAPYGRYVRRGWGLTINNRLGWVIMESAAPLAFAVCFFIRANAITATTLVFLGLWEAHYLHRAFIYPFSLRHRSLPLVIVGFGLLFNMVNGYLNGRYIFTFSGTFSDGYSNQWLGDPRFIIGVSLFVIGFVINRQADNTLRNLAKTSDSGYKIPYGGLYRWISCPNYFGEILIWTGWAVATWSLPGLAFAVWTAANLVPRARSHHAWYRQNFPDYPPRRRALLPGLW